MSEGSERYDAHLDEYRGIAYINSPEMYKEVVRKVIEFSGGVLG